MDRNLFQKRKRKSVVNISDDFAVPTSSKVEVLWFHQRKCTDRSQGSGKEST